LKDHVEYLQLLGGGKKVKWKKIKNNGRGDVVMDAIKSLPYREDIQKLFARYDSSVLCASVNVLVNNDSLELRSLLSSRLEDFPPTAEPATEQAPPYDHPCDPEVAAEDDEGTKDAEPEAIEEEYVDVRDLEEKPCGDDFPVPEYDDDYGDNSASDKPGDPEEGPPRWRQTQKKYARLQ
jgi:hypothetical protein